LDRWFEKLTDASAIASDGFALKDLLTQLTRELGFNHFAYLNLKASESYAVSNYPEEWQDLYFERGYSAIDPVVWHARRKMRAFVWTHDHINMRSRETKRFISEAMEFKICSGITIPVHGDFGSLAMLTLATGSRGLPAEWHIDPILAATSVAQVHACFRRRSNTTAVAVRLARLKPKEITCLKWSAEGKTLQDIAVIEGLKYNNVCFHIKEARRKLDTITLQQATARATKLNLI